MKDDRRWTMDGRRWIVVILLTLASSSTLMTGCAAPVAIVALTKVETGVDSTAWAKVPAGDFVLGQHEEKGSVQKSYAIMVTDVTNDQYAQ